jgi:hypothetical protein
MAYSQAEYVFVLEHYFSPELFTAVLEACSNDKGNSIYVTCQIAYAHVVQGVLHHYNSK